MQYIDRERQMLVQKMKELGLIKHQPDNPFTLSSGDQSPWYFDVKSALMENGCLYYIERLFGAHLKSLRPSLVGGPANAAYSLVSLISRWSGLRGFVRRKEIKQHGLEHQVDGWRPRPDSRVVVVDDVLTTGSSIAPTIAYVQGCGAEVVAIIPVIDRREDRNHVFESLIQPLLRLGDLEI